MPPEFKAAVLVTYDVLHDDPLLVPVAYKPDLIVYEVTDFLRGDV